MCWFKELITRNKYVPLGYVTRYDWCAISSLHCSCYICTCIHVYLFFLGGFYFHYKTCHTYVWGKINLKWKFWVFTYIIIPAFINKILHMNDNLCGLLASFVPRLLVATQSLHWYKANGHLTITLVTVHLMYIHVKLLPYTKNTNRFNWSWHMRTHVHCKWHATTTMHKAWHKKIHRKVRREMSWISLL